MGEGLPVEGKIAPADAVERIVIEHFGTCRLRQLVVVGHIEHLVQTFAKVVRVFGGGHIAVFAVIDHFRNSSHAETQTGDAAGECFHDGVGQVLGNGGEYKKLGRVVNIDDGVDLVGVGGGEHGDVEGGSKLFCGTAENEECSVSAVFRVGGEVLPEGFHQVGHAFVEIRDALGDKEHDTQGRVGGQTELCASFRTIAGSEHGGVDGIGDVDHGFPVSERRTARLAGKPSAACHESHGGCGIDRLFLRPYAVRQVVGRTAVREVGTLSTFLAVAGARQGQMTNAGDGPDVVHRPNHGFPVAKYALQLVEREESLVDPMQMDHVGASIGIGFGDVSSCYGGIDGEKSSTLSAQMEENAQPFSDKRPLHAPPSAKRMNFRGRRLSIAHQHFSLDTDMGQGRLQTRRGNGRSAGSFAGVDDQNAHGDRVIWTKIGRKPDMTKFRIE